MGWPYIRYLGIINQLGFRLTVRSVSEKIVFATWLFETKEILFVYYYIIILFFSSFWLDIKTRVRAQSHPLDLN
jgi:hypothetical protein